MRRGMTAALAWGSLALTAVGCGSATKYVAASTGTADQIKFLYVEKNGDQGVIKCQRAADGTLSQCRTMRLRLAGD